MTDKKRDNEAEVVAAIEAMDEPDRTMGRRLHEIIKANAPNLWSRTWYGMPAYTDGAKIICFFRARAKFGERYMTLGFNDTAKLDEGTMWPTYFALTELTDANAEKVAQLVKKSVS